MAKTNAERQAAYRARQQQIGEGSARRISTWVSLGTALALERLARRYGVTQREMLERLVQDADNSVTAILDPDSPEWQTYFDRSLVTP